MQKISSLSNPFVKHLVKLQTSKYRDKYQEFLAEGVRVNTALIDAGHEPRCMVVTPDTLHAAQSFIDDERIVCVTDEVMKKISMHDSPAGIIGLFSIMAEKPYSEISSGVVFFKMQNPGNIGTLIRTAVAMNKKTAIFIESVDPFNPKVVQATAGTIGSINIFQMSLEDLIKNKGNRKLYALAVKQGNTGSDTDLHDSLVMVGNEAHGIPAECLQLCDGVVTIDMPGPCESLNASIAGSIALYLSTLSQK